MSWCRQAPSHYLNQCWPTSLTTYGVAIPQWVKVLIFQDTPHHPPQPSLAMLSILWTCLFILTHWGRDKMADDIFKCLFLNKNVWISLKISLKFLPKVRNNNIPTLVQIMAWRRPGDKPSSEPMMVSLLTHICVTRPHWIMVTSFHIPIDCMFKNLSEMKKRNHQSSV